MKKVLITPLDWGLGHAARCIPIIRELCYRKCDVYIGGSGSSMELLKTEFPELTYIDLPGYRPEYSSGNGMVWKMAMQAPKFSHVIKEEHRLIDDIVKRHNIDVIISDNRYGCWSAKIPSIFITHQLNILMPTGYGWLSRGVNFLNQRFIKKFSICWIPDYPERNVCLSGELSYASQTSGSIRYIGPLSRFSSSLNNTCNYDVACVLSGPEPQRTIFENIVTRQIKASGLRYYLVRGLYSNNINSDHASADHVAPFLNSASLQTVISQSALVVARSGYSTIMDLVALEKKGILVPTPGQTEQEYLADRFYKKGIFYTMPQRTFDFEVAFKESGKYTGILPVKSQTGELLGRSLDEILS